MKALALSVSLSNFPERGMPLSVASSFYSKAVTGRSSVRIMFSRLTQAVCYDVCMQPLEGRVAAATREVCKTGNGRSVRKALK